MNKTFLNIPNAAKLSGFSLRHFRRIVEQYKLPLVEIHIGNVWSMGSLQDSEFNTRPKHFMLTRTVEKWLSDMKDPKYVVRFKLNSGLKTKTIRNHTDYSSRLSYR